MKNILEKIQNQAKIIYSESRIETAVPARGVKELPNNFFVSHLVDKFILKCKVEGDEDVKCDKCDEDDPVVSYCPDCSFFYVKHVVRHASMTDHLMITA